MEAGARDHVGNPIRTQAGWLAGLWSALRVWAYGIFSDDETLVLRARARDHAAFDALVARYRGRLYTMARRSLGSEREAADALRETLLSAYRDLDSIGVNCTPSTWLYVHGFRAVFKRMNAPAGKYTVESRPAGGTSPQAEA